eukprot:5106768-Alexandrium_andersonii.AAC.1
MAHAEAPKLGQGVLVETFAHLIHIAVQNGPHHGEDVTLEDSEVHRMELVGGEVADGQAGVHE